MFKRLIDLIWKNRNVKITNKRLKMAFKVIKIINAFFIEIAKLAMILFVIFMCIGGIIWVCF